MVTSNSAISFQGLSSGIQTDALVSAILAQEGKNLSALQARQTRNQKKTTILGTLRTSMGALSVSLAALKDKLNAQLVTTTDSNNTYVTATASGSITGNYDIKITSVATRGRISSTLDGSGYPTNLAVADPSAAIFTGGGGKASFAVRGTDGVLKAFEVTTNSLYGLRDAINASGAGVSASIINTGSGSSPYQLVISATNTGTGSTAGIVTLAAIANSDASVATVNASLGITTGTLTGTFATPTDVTGGLTSTASGANASDAVFTLNGIQLTRSSNVVSDAADGITFTLKQGGQSGTTTLTVAQDKTTATTAMQDLVTKFNALLKIYKDAATSTKNSDGSINQGTLAGDATTRNIISQIRTTLGGASAGLSSSSAFQVPAAVGLRTNPDGTLTLDTVTFQSALEKDGAAVRRLFYFTGESTNGAVAFKSATAATATGSLGFTISNYSAGSFTATFTGTTNSPITVQGTNGTLIGATGTDIEGLTLSVTGNGTGTLSLTRGAGQAASDLIAALTSTGSGAISVALNNIESQNKSLLTQIDAAQAMLDRRKKVLLTQFAKMETTIGQLKAAGGSLTTF